jgi:beta-lactamase regulating signal transducer with metallopeptidase domain
MILYLIQSTLCLGLLFVVYKFVLEGERMHHFKRFYLLFAIIFSLTVPLVQLSISVSWWSNINDISPLTWMGSAATEQTFTNTPAVSLDMLIYLYILGVILFTSRFIIQLGALYRQIEGNPKLNFEDYSLVLTSQETVPHTFGSYIFLNAKAYANGKIEPELLAHELAHVRERHSADVMILELLKIGLWFQPLIYLYQRAIRLNHEFLADAAVLNKRADVTDYQHLLLDKVAGSNKIYLASNLNFLLTKKRLNMMTKNTSQRRVWILSSLTLPLFIALLLAFAQPVDAQNNPKVSTDAPISQKDIKADYFKNATFIFKKDGKKIKKKYNELSSEQKEAIPMPPPPPPAPAAPPAPDDLAATPPAPPTPPTLKPLKKGTIIEVDFEKNRLWIKGNGDAIAPPPPPLPPPPPPTKGN